MWEIPIFAAEKEEEGLIEKIRSNASVAYFSPARLIEQKDKQDIIRKTYSATASANKGQPDLFYLDTILVTTGCSNKNDDLFLKTPTWAARHTPVDKPFNFGHDQLDIIGHITSSCVVDEEYKAIADTSTVDELPDKFHILTEAVIYKSWSDKDQAERIEQLIAEIKEDKWFVSMECLFRGFDYGVFDSKGNCRVIARDEESAFLSKHLRAYGGTGKYNDERICRVLSNFVFSGKGLVENPANPESIIFNEVIDFSSIASIKFNDFKKMGYINLSSSNSNEINNLEEQKDLINLNRENEIMADEVKDLKALLDNAIAEKNALAKKLEDGQAQMAKAAEDKITELSSAVDAEKKKVKDAEDKVVKAEEKIAELEKEVAAAKTENDAMKKTVNEFKKASKTAKAGLTDDEAKAFLADWAEASDEMFDKALSLVQQAKEAKAGEGSLDKPDTVKKVAEVKPGDDSGAQKVNNNTGSNVKSVAEKTVDSAETDEKSTASDLANVNSEVETARASLSKYLEGKLGRNKRK